MKPGLSISKSPAQIKADVAEQIAVEASRLARLANTNEFGLLAYLIDMVVLEAWREASESEPTKTESPFQGVNGI